MTNRLRNLAEQLASDLVSRKRALLTPAFKSNDAPEVALMAALLVALKERSPGVLGFPQEGETDADLMGGWIRACRAAWTAVRGGAAVCREGREPKVGASAAAAESSTTCAAAGYAPSVDFGRPTNSDPSPTSPGSRVVLTKGQAEEILRGAVEYSFAPEANAAKRAYLEHHRAVTALVRAARAESMRHAEHGKSCELCAAVAVLDKGVARIGEHFNDIANGRDDADDEDYRRSVAAYFLRRGLTDREIGRRVESQGLGAIVELVADAHRDINPPNSAGEPRDR